VGCDVAEGAVEPNLVVVGDEVADDAASLLDVPWSLVPELFVLERAVPAFQFAVALRVVGARADVGDAGQADELFKVLGDELGPIVGDDPGLLARVFLEGPLDDGLDFGLLHGLANLPVNDRPAVAVEHRAEEVERAGDVEVGDVDMPVFVGFERLHEALALLGGSPLVAVEQARPLEDSVDTGGAHGDDVLIEHHVGEPPVAFERESAVVVDDRLLLPSLQPSIPGDVAVVGMGPAVVLLPEVVLAGRQAHPGEDSLGGQLGTGRPLADVVDHFVTGVGGNPASFQSSPLAFFARTFSSMSSEITSFFWAILASFWATTASSWAILASLADSAALAPLLEVKDVGAVLEHRRLPPVDLAGLELVLVTQV